MEAVEQMSILTHHQVGVQGHRLAHLGQAIQGGHRHFELIAQAVDIDNQVRRLLFSQRAAQTSNHVAILPHGHRQATGQPYQQMQWPMALLGQNLFQRMMLSEP
ncbi:hypothetical protein D9M72_547030 [compost metagenome]